MEKRFMFRAWDKEENMMRRVVALNWAELWVQTEYVVGKGYPGERHNFFDNDDSCNRFILMQCTGNLAAKSYRGESEDDRLVWEGDILRHIRDGRLFSVIWDSDDGRFLGVNGNGSERRLLYISDQLQKYAEVAGNIHEHPELLGGGQG